LKALVKKQLAELTFVAFDVETTGLDPQADRVVEIGAVRFGRDGLEDEYQRLVNPECPISQDAAAIHGITADQVASSPPFPAVLPGVLEFFGDSLLIAHNAPFDMGFFDAALARAGIRPPRNTVLCTLQLARALIPGLNSYGLESLVRRLGIPGGAHHRALADAVHSAELFGRCVERIGSGWETSLAGLLKLHGPPLRFGASAGAGVSAHALEIIKAAMEKDSSVRMEYRSADGKITVRTITPLSIDESGRHIKVIAFCHLRGGNRTFRLDCIKKIE